MTASIRDKVAVVGVGCCQFGENWQLLMILRDLLDQPN